MPLSLLATRARLLSLATLFVLASAPAHAQDGSALGRRGYVAANGLYQTTDTRFTNLVEIDVYRETGTLTATHEVGRGPAFDITAGGPIRGYVGLSYAFSYFRRSDQAAVSARVPHPFFFDRHRVVTGSGDDLDREERAFHLSLVGLLPMTERFQAIVFGGPSYFWVWQETPTSVAVSESYPYDEAAFAGVTPTREKSSGWGYNVGVDLSYYFSTHAGVGGLVRYAPAVIDFPSNTGSVEIDAGGLQVGGGVRFRF